MNSGEPDKDKEGNRQDAPELLVQGVADVVNAAFGVGASLARTVAEVTAKTKPVPAPPTNAAPLNAIIHYGIITVGNLFNMFGVGSGSRAQASGTTTTAGATAQGTNATRPAAGQAREVPRVQRGATLRIPLSIENPGNEPMQQMTFLCLSMKGGGGGRGVPVSVSAVRFQPEALSVAPKDFEKLTVFIDTGFDTAPGVYEAVLGLGGGVFEMPVRFEVLQ